MLRTLCCLVLLPAFASAQTMADILPRGMELDEAGNLQWTKFHAEDCEPCEATGERPCWFCEAEGEGCAFCEDGTVGCPPCDATGQTKDPFDAFPCLQCQGLGRHRVQRVWERETGSPRRGNSRCVSVARARAHSNALSVSVPEAWSSRSWTGWTFGWRSEGNSRRSRSSLINSRPARPTTRRGGRSCLGTDRPLCRLRKAAGSRPGGPAAAGEPAGTSGSALESGGGG